MTQVVRDMRGFPIQALYQGTIQNLTIGGSAQQSAAVGPFTDCVTLAGDADCYILITTAGTAATSTNASFLPAGAVYTRGVKPGASIISVIQKGTSSGTLNITENI